MLDKVLNRFTVGFGVGYVLGARAGRERYEQIQGWWDSFIGTPAVREVAQRGREAISEAGKQVASTVSQSQRTPQDIREVMTATPETVATTSTLAETAKKMKKLDAGAMIVVDASQKVRGIVTDRDIAIRAVAEGRDPNTTKVGDIASEDIEVLAPTDSVERAVKLMRERNIRRLPVVEEGRPLGIVSIGDLAEERDPRSALADISRAPANR